MQTRISIPELPELERFFERLVKQVKDDSHFITLDGTTVRINPSWIRDHVHELKAYKFWEKDVTSALEFLCERQTASGFFYELFVANDNVHTRYVNSDCVQRYPNDKLALVRLELEADVEYLMVEGCFQAWQATGDDEWLRKVLPHLAKGLEYCLTNPKRWDAAHGLLKRNFTIDTWDFSWGATKSGPSGNRRIEPPIPMAIMHGDNTGLIQACHQLERLYSHLGDATASADWDRKAGSLRANLFTTCWNGVFFTHQVHLGGNPLPEGETPEERRLSLSNAYALNRGVLDFAQGRSILNEYQTRRARYGDGSAFSDWYTIDPPYQPFRIGRDSMPAGTYVNGGFAGFVGGELAKGAFRFGAESYGWDLLQRAMGQVMQDGSIYFLYSKEGRNLGNGPAGWSAAAFVSALIEGLAGIEDQGALWRDVQISPRWAITGVKQAGVTVAYGPSGAGMGYDWKLSSGRISLTLNGGGVQDAKFHVLLPANARLAKVLAAGRPINASEVVLADSRYADFEIKRDAAIFGSVIEVMFQ